MNPSMNAGYLIYQAERPRSSAEQRTIDAVNGELARSFTRRPWPRTVSRAPGRGLRWAARSRTA